MATVDDDLMKNVDAVIKKWEAKAGPSSVGNYAASDTGNQPGKEAWQAWHDKHGQAPRRQPSKYRPKKRKPKVRH